MKRVLTFILVLSMVLGSVGMVFADTASDIAGHKNERAILRLNNLGIVEGDDRGFAPDDSITRAEFAVLVVRALGLEGSANVSKGDTAFTDVTIAAGYEWASGAINVATKLGYIQGYGGGLFGPADNIRYEDAITLIVRVLGYEPVVQTKGGYPVGYLVVAEQDLDITDHVDGAVGLAATRGSVFQLLDNSLTKPLMIQVGYGDDAKFVISGQKGTETEKQTILTDRLGLELVEDEIVTEIARVSSLKDNRIRIGNKVYKVVGEVDYEEAFGAEVEAWLNDDDEVVYVEVVSDEIYLDAIEWNSVKEELKLVDADTKYDLAKNVRVFIDGSSKKIGDLSSEYEYAKVVLDDDGDVAFIDAYNWDDLLVVEKVDGNYVYGYGDEVNAKDFSVVKDGRTIGLDNLEKGDIFFYSRSGDGFAEVFNKTVVGEIERIYDDSIKVEGKEYKRDIAKYLDEDDEIEYIDSSSLLKDIAEAMQDAGEVAVFLNRAGDMVFLSGDIGDLKTSSDFVFLTAGSKKFDDRGIDKWSFDILSAQGAEVEYNVKDADVIPPKLLKNVAGVATLWDTSGSSTSNVITKKLVTELKLDSDGKIDQIRLLTSHSVAGPLANIKTDEKYYSGIKIDPNAVVYLIEDFIKPDGKVKDIDIEVYKDLDFDYIDSGVFYEKDDKIVAIVVETSSRKDDSVTHLTVATANDSKVAGKTQYTLKLVLDREKVTKDTKVGITGYPGVNKGDLLEVEVDKKTGRLNSVAGAPYQVAPGVVSGLNTTKESLKIGNVADLKLGIDGVVVDATDSYKVISFSSLKNGDSVKAARVDSGSKYLDVIVRTAKAGDTPPSEVATDGKVTYIAGTYVIVDGQEIDIIGSAAEFFTNDAIAIGDKIAYELSAGDKMYKITAVDGNLSLDANDNYSTFADLVVNGDLTITTTGAGTVTASNVTVKGDLTVNVGATLAATNFVVEGTTTVNGTATFNSNLKGDVIVTGAATFRNVTIGGDLDVTTGTATFDGSVKVAGDISGASNITLAAGADAATKKLVEDQQAADTAEGKLNSVTIAAGDTAGTVKLTNGSDVIVEYSVEGGAWADLAASADKDDIEVDAGDVIQVRVKTPVSAAKEITVKLSDIKPATMSGAIFTDDSKDVTGLTTGVVYQVRITVGTTVGDWVTYTAANGKIVLDEAAATANTYEIRIKATDKQPASTVQSETGF